MLERTVACFRPTRTPPALALCALVMSVPVACATDEKAEKSAAPAPVDAPEPESAAAGSSNDEGFMYPDTAMGTVEDDYHGTLIKDPYRWLEDPDSDATKAWVEAENKVTFAYLESIPEREPLKKRLTELWNYPRQTAPFKKGERLFMFKNDGLQNQDVLFSQTALDQPATVLLDPNTLADDGTVALTGLSFTKDGKKLAYATSSAGSDWKTWRVRDVETGKDLEDTVERGKFSGASWKKDGSGFYYSRYPSPKEGDDFEEANYFHKVYFHKLGTPQSADTLVFEDQENKERGFDAHVTEDGAFLILHVWKGTDRRNRIYYQALKRGRVPKTVKLLDAFDAAYEFIGNKKNIFYFKTDLGAERSRVIAIDIKKSDKKYWKEVISESEDPIDWVKMVGNGFLVGQLHNAYDKLSFYDLKGTKVRDIPLPIIGSTTGFRGEQADTETYYTLTSFTYPNTTFHLNLETGESTLFKKAEVKFNPDDFETRQEWFTSKDGTKVPMFIVHKKGLAMNGENPTYLYAYGGFNISLTPKFSIGLIGLLERNFVFALPNLRGGGEFGEAWHQAGMLDNKQNVFDDFAAAARHLIDTKVTRKEKLAIGGGSNGGLLVGATVTQNPDLVQAAIARVGVLDMLRYHKFTIGHAWVSEYGSSADAEQFKTLIKYSPLHNVKAGTAYPATLILTADHDDRVVPAHSFKFAAALQKAHAGERPTVIRIETKAGHGAGKPTAKVIEETADYYAFMIRELGESSASTPAMKETANAADATAATKAGAQ